MNRTKIEWTDFSWNPVTGCKYGCWYCYAQRLYHRFHRSFEPTFHPERLDEPWKYRIPSKIFCCSVSDLFAPWTLPEWRDQVLLSIYGCPVKHTFQLLTRHPERIPSHTYPFNLWIGTTVTCEHPDFPDWINLESIKKIQCGARFASFEPLLGMLPEDVSLKGLDWIIIGKLTGSRRIDLKPEWVWRIYNEARWLGIPVFLKNNLRRTPMIKENHTLNFQWLQQFPGQEADKIETL
jgi:protein gp37